MDGMSFSSMSWVQHQQPFTQLHPQVHISHYPNIVPYQQIVSSLYVPQLLVPNYSTSSVPTHPSRGSNYFMMPGGNPQLNSGGLSMVHHSTRLSKLVRLSDMGLIPIQVRVQLVPSKVQLAWWTWLGSVLKTVISMLRTHRYSLVFSNISKSHM